ncbi:unnamed protein product [Hymenolepis diminuta]|uniref:non-specific serine/threonine protein kinase n=1 Tax=Hymenolepis diminuta TaxID=6216 RepID=A0A3P6W3V1_HYMDI|nr:unnamed protein product [Hymenolepis diminuta]
MHDVCGKPHGNEYCIEETKSRAKFKIKIFEEKYSERAREEIDILEKLRGSTNIIKMVGSVIGSEIPKCCILYEYIQSTVWSVFKKLNKIDDIKNYSYQMLLALDSCHSQNIIHRYINLDALLINIEGGILKLGGWDYAVEHRDGNSYETDTNLVYYRSPELLIDIKKHDFAVDLWAAGCVIASFVFLKVHIFDGCNNEQQLSKIALILGGEELLEFIQQQNVTLDETSRKEVARFSGTGFQILISHKCKKTATEEAVDLVRSLLVSNPTRRLSAKEALSHAFFSKFFKNDCLETVDPNLVQKVRPLDTERDEQRLISIENIYSKCLVGRVLGQGAYGTVYYAKEVESGREFAVKALKEPRTLKSKREIEVLNKLRGYPNVIPILGVIECDEIETSFIIFKCINEVRWEYLYKTLSSEDIKRYVYQLLSALDACHSRGIMHRDIKPSNLLIDHLNRHLYLADWGLAKFYEEGKPNGLNVLTRPYKSPELLLNYVNYDYSVDIWPVGCILASALFRKRHIFLGGTNMSQLEEIVKVLGYDCVIDFCRKYGTKINPDQVKTLHYYKRISWTNFINDSNRNVASTKAIDLLSKLLVFDHKQRLTAVDALKHNYFEQITDPSQNVS